MRACMYMIHSSTDKNTMDRDRRRQAEGGKEKTNWKRKYCADGLGLRDSYTDELKFYINISCYV